MERKEKRTTMDIINFRHVSISFTEMCICDFFEISTMIFFGLKTMMLDNEISEQLEINTKHQLICFSLYWLKHPLAQETRYILL